MIVHWKVSILRLAQCQFRLAGLFLLSEVGTRRHNCIQVSVYLARKNSFWGDLSVYLSHRRRKRHFCGFIKPRDKSLWHFTGKKAVPYSSVSFVLRHSVRVDPAPGQSEIVPPHHVKPRANASQCLIHHFAAGLPSGTFDDFSNKSLLNFSWYRDNGV